MFGHILFIIDINKVPNNVKSELDFVTDMKDLGVLIDEHLSFETYIQDKSIKQTQKLL